MIGRRCRCSDAHSRALLIARKLPPRAFRSSCPCRPLPPVGGVSVVGAVVSDRSRRVPQASCLSCPVLAATVRLVTWLVVPLACFLVRCQPIRSARVRSGDIDSGGYSCGAPPLPIPNREVKPARADGTAPQSGRVGRRRLREGLLAGFPVGRFFFVPIVPICL